MIALIQGGLLVFQLVCGMLIAYAFHRAGVIGNLGLSAIAGIAIAFSFQFFLIGADFFLSRLFSGQSASDNPASFMSTVKAWLRESIDCIRVFSFMHAFRSSSAYPTANPTVTRAIPVLLVHGFFCNRGLWHDFAKVLADHGHTVQGVSLEPVWGSIDEYPKQVNTAVQKLQAQTGARQIALIGHSMGGLAIRSYLRDFGHGSVAKVITLGTPHQGTWIAQLGHGINVKQMGLDSLWLTQLAKTETAELAAKITVVLSDQDNIVFPQLQQELPHAKTIRVSGMGHISMVFDANVQGIALDELKLVG